MEQKRTTIYHELLILQAQGGNKEAFEGLVKVWDRPFFSYARAYTGCEAAAWDIVQETWVVIIGKLNALSHPTKFKGWAFRILNHKCVDHFRKASADKKLSHSLAEKTDRKDAQNSDEHETLHAALQQLTSDQKTLVLLRFNQAMSILEISTILGIPEGTVKSRLHRTLNELKLSLQGD